MSLRRKLRNLSRDGLPTKMSIHMITAGELRFVRDVLYDLSALADPSEYLEEDVQEAYRILDSLVMYDSGFVCEVIDEVNRLNDKEDPQSE